jgi:hypothetical protein
MPITSDIPYVAVVRVSSSGGPFHEGDVLSIAFSTAPICRLAQHSGAAPLAKREPGDALVPETIAVSVVVAGGPYAAGDVLALSFVDPSIARIHAVRSVAPSQPVPPTEERFEAPAPLRSQATLPAGRTALGVRTRLAWSADRVRRFVQVCDKLFTVDRLGWYRHTLAMRLLLADEVSCGEPQVDREIIPHLRALRTSALETLGRPLLAAFMPSFYVTPEWLDSLDDPVAARAVAALREAIQAHAVDDRSLEGSGDSGWSEGEITRGELMETPATSLEAFLPLLIANVSPLEALTNRLTAYRRALVDLFGQTAGSVEAVRLSQMTQPNHVLDDRLWQLVGAVGECLGGLATAS